MSDGPKRGIGLGPGMIGYISRKARGMSSGKLSGPKRGIGLGPGQESTCVTKPKKAPKLPTNRKPVPPPPMLMAHEGPKRGIGFGPGITFEFMKRNSGPTHARGIGPGLTEASGPDLQCLKLINEFRAKNNKPPVKYSKFLSDIARPHTINMLNQKYPLSHTGFQERSKQASGAYRTGENVAYCDGYSDPIKIMMDGWIKSPGHRANLLGDFNQVGLAFEHRSDLWYGTQFFAFV